MADISEMSTIGMISTVSSANTMASSTTVSTMMSSMSSMTGMQGMSMSTSNGMHSSMNMGGMSGMASSSSMSGMSMSCTMSMLWNWYTDDVCFISNKWKTTTKAKFGGSCVGVFALLLALNWLRRFMNEYKNECAKLRLSAARVKISSCKTLKSRAKPFIQMNIGRTALMDDLANPFLQVLRHNWLNCISNDHFVLEGNKMYIYQSYLEHTLSCVLSTIEWSVLHVTMLLFMYFNGYIFISCMIGTGVGYFLFQYKAVKPLYGYTSPKRCCV